MSLVNRLFGKLVAKLPGNNRLERIWKLAHVDFKKRYYNDRLGLFWALIKPIFEVALYTIVFTIIFKKDQENFPLFLFSGLIFWMFFAETTTKGMKLLSNKLYLIENIQFNKVDLFISFSLSTFIALCFNLAAYSFFSFANGIYFSAKIFLLLLPFSALFLLTTGITLIIGTAQPFLKDLQHFWDLAIKAGLWMSGIFFTLSEISGSDFAILSFINPLIGIFHNIRASLLPSFSFDYSLMSINFLYCGLIFLLGMLTFRKFGTLAVEKL